MPAKNKADEETLANGQRLLSLGGIDVAHTDLYGDQDFTSLGDQVVRQGGSYNSGIANRSNSHAPAENCVKNGLGAMCACSLQAAYPQKDWPSLARALTVNMSREIGNKYW